MFLVFYVRVCAVQFMHAMVISTILVDIIADFISYTLYSRLSVMRSLRLTLMCLRERVFLLIIGI